MVSFWVENDNTIFSHINCEDLLTNTCSLLHMNYQDLHKHKYMDKKMFHFQKILKNSNFFTFSGLKLNKLFLDLALFPSRRLPLRHVFSAGFPGVVPLG